MTRRVLFVVATVLPFLVRESSNRGGCLEHLNPIPTNLETLYAHALNNANVREKTT